MAILNEQQVQPPKPHLSASQLDLYARCSEAYRRRYIEGDKIPPAIANLRGRAVHVAAAHNFKQKIDSRRDLPQAEVVDVAVGAFDAELQTGFSLSEDEESVGVSRVTGDARDEVAELARCHVRLQAPDYQPVFVEQTVRLSLPGTRDVLGILDLCDDRKRVVDFKTAKKKKSQSEVDTSVQLTIYAAAYHALTGETPASVSLDTTVDTSKGVVRQVLESQRSESDFVALAHRIDAIERAINAGVFTPASPGTWWCGPKYCGFWRSCPFVNSERAALAAE